MMDVLVSVQRGIYDWIGGYLATFAETGDWAALLTVAPLGIVFGAVHALTPGHSKTVLASYLVGSRLALVRSLAVSTILAATHVLVAVIIALFASQLLTKTLAGAGRTPELEQLSRGLIVLIGFWYLARAVRGSNHARKHQEGIAVGVIAGLIPCPLTLFVMVLALSRGVPEAGLAFAASMLIGIALTLGLVAIAAVFGRRALTAGLASAGTSVSATARGLDGLAGVLLIAFGALEFMWVTSV